MVGVGAASGEGDGVGMGAAPPSAAPTGGATVGAPPVGGCGAGGGLSPGGWPVGCAELTMGAVPLLSNPQPKRQKLRIAGAIPAEIPSLRVMGTSIGLR
jgi:hypothetical protein